MQASVPWNVSRLLPFGMVFNFPNTRAVLKNINRKNAYLSLGSGDNAGHITGSFWLRDTQADDLLAQQAIFDNLVFEVCASKVDDRRQANHKPYQTKTGTKNMTNST